MNDTFARFRANRIDKETRDRVRETAIDIRDFIWPAFVIDGTNRSEPVSAMPGVSRMSADRLIEALEPLIAAGLESVLLFGIPSRKGVDEAWNPNGAIQRAIPLVARAYPRLKIITDVCLCSYTDDGHCHVGDNDETCRLLARVARSHAESGAHIVAPSAMMDGQVLFIKEELDRAGLGKVPIMSYAAKYASHFYGPFRDAAACAPRHGDRRGYQMDPGNSDEALEEIASDLDQGAGSIIIKPALSYLDIVRRARDRFPCDLVAYNVSGEYRMLTDAIAAGYARRSIIPESLLSMKRAGADKIISYFVPELVKGGFSHDE